MANNEKALSVLLLALAVLSILISSSISPAFAFAAAEDDHPGAAGSPTGEPYKVVNELCGSVRDVDKEFCLKALKSDPRSVSVKDNTALLNITVDLALAKIKVANDYVVRLSKRDPKPPLTVAIKDCLDAYKIANIEIKGLPGELADDPDLVDYDALQAFDACETCRTSLEKNKITDPSLSSNNAIATKYVLLCVAVGRTF